MYSLSCLAQISSAIPLVIPSAGPPACFPLCAVYQEADEFRARVAAEMQELQAELDAAREEALSRKEDEPRVQPRSPRLQPSVSAEETVNGFYRRDNGLHRTHDKSVFLSPSILTMVARSV